jgi:hypothetical protein
MGLMETSFTAPLLGDEKNLKYPLAGGERFLVKYGCKAK